MFRGFRFIRKKYNFPSGYFMNHPNRFGIVFSNDIRRILEAEREKQRAQRIQDFVLFVSVFSVFVVASAFGFSVVSRKHPPLN